MNPILIYDTETTGLPDFKAPSESEHQPHIVQLAAILVDPDTRKTVASMDVIVRPDSWMIPAEVSAVHGITHEHALQVGVSESLALEMLMELWAGRTRVAHNEQFDARIIRIALKRYGPFRQESADAEADRWKEGSAECTARMATPICALPPTDKMRAVGRHHHKTPNLTEAYRHFTGQELRDAHSAMADVLACRDIYFAMKDTEKEAA